MFSKLTALLIVFLLLSGKVSTQTDILQSIAMNGVAVPSVSGLNLPPVILTSMMGPCANFLPANVPAEIYSGTFYKYKMYSPISEITYSCASTKFSSPIDNTVFTNVSASYFNLNRSHEHTGYVVYIALQYGLNVIASISDPTLQSLSIPVGYIKDVGFAEAHCPISSCSCGQYFLNVFVKPDKVNATVIDNLVAQAQNHYVPVSKLFSINNTNCPTPTSALPVPFVNLGPLPNPVNLPNLFPLTVKL